MQKVITPAETKNRCRSCNLVSGSKIEFSTRNLALIDSKSSSVYSICRNCCAANLVGETIPTFIEATNFQFFGRSGVKDSKTVKWISNKRARFFLRKDTITGALIAYIFGDPYGLRKYRKLINENREDILDFGTADGKFLHLLNQNFRGKQLYGYDPFIRYKEDNMNVHISSSWEDFPEKKLFDLVTLNHVIEHLESPDESIKELVSRMKPGGEIVIRTPLFNSPLSRLFKSSWIGLYSPFHLVVFTKNNLSDLCQRLGLSIVEMQTDCTLWSIISSVMFALKIPFRHHLKLHLLLLPISFPFLIILHLTCALLNSMGLGDTVFIRAIKQTTKD